MQRRVNNCPYRRQLQHYLKHVLPKLGLECQWPVFKIDQVILDAVFRQPWYIPLNSKPFITCASDEAVKTALNICALVLNEPSLIHYLHYRSNCYRGKSKDILRSN